MLVPLFRATICPPLLSTGSRTRTLLFAHPPCPVIAKGSMMRPAFSDPHQLAPGPTRPSRPHLGTQTPHFRSRSTSCFRPIAVQLYSLAIFLPLCHAPVPFPPGATPDLERGAEKRLAKNSILISPRTATKHSCQQQPVRTDDIGTPPSKNFCKHDL